MTFLGEREKKRKKDQLNVIAQAIQTTKIPNLIREFALMKIFEYKDAFYM